MDQHISVWGKKHGYKLTITTTTKLVCKVMCTTIFVWENQPCTCKIGIPLLTKFIAILLHYLDTTTELLLIAWSIFPDGFSWSCKTLKRLWQSLVDFNKVALVWNCFQSSMTVTRKPALPCSVVWGPCDGSFGTQLVPLFLKGSLSPPSTPFTPPLLPPTCPLKCGTCDILCRVLKRLWKTSKCN